VRAVPVIPPHKHSRRELKFRLEGRLIWGEESVPARERDEKKAGSWNLMSFCASAGEAARATLITLCNELRCGESIAGRQRLRAVRTHRQKSCIHTFQARMDGWH